MSVKNRNSIVTDGLVFYVDAGNEDSYAGSGTTWSDLVGDNNGTFSATPTTDSANGGSIVFDGVDDYGAINSILTSRPFSINFMVYFSSLSGWQTILGQDTDASTPFGRFYFQKTHHSQNISPRINNTVGFAIRDTSLNSVLCYDPNVVEANTWYNYCATISPTNISLFKNGEQVNTISNSNDLSSPTGNILIGAGYYNNNIVDYVDGKIPLLNIYNRALSSDEILQNYNALKNRFI
jgi:hypothetical protein